MTDGRRVRVEWVDVATLPADARPMLVVDLSGFSLIGGGVVLTEAEARSLLGDLAVTLHLVALHESADSRQ